MVDSGLSICISRKNENITEQVFLRFQVLERISVRAGIIPSNRLRNNLMLRISLTRLRDYIVDIR